MNSFTVRVTVCRKVSLKLVICVYHCGKGTKVTYIIVEESTVAELDLEVDFVNASLLNVNGSAASLIKKIIYQKVFVETIEVQFLP